MWGLPFIAGNVMLDFACLNRVELLPWDFWGMRTPPFVPVPDENAEVLDVVAALANGDDVGAITARYGSDYRLRVPSDVTTIVDGQPRAIHLDL